MQAALTSQLQQRITGDGAEALIEKIRTEATSIISLDPATRAKAVESYHVALRWVWLLNLALALLNFLISLPIEEHPLPGSFEEEQKIREERDQRGLESGTATPARRSRD